jgi:hypothetical protein
MFSREKLRREISHQKNKLVTMLIFSTHAKSRFLNHNPKGSKLSHAPRAGGLNMAEMQEVKEMDLRRGGRWGRDKMEG